MPLVNIYLQDVWNESQIKNISDDIHESLVRAFKIPGNDYNHRVIKLSKEGVIHSDRKSDKCIFIEMYIFPGRSKEAKRKLYEEIFKRMKDYGIQQNDLIIVLNEPPMMNWGMNGKRGDETEIGFNLNV
jgi:phenylpyruvate tautomerase PptA (4-oxalocrotonate tautomerase family)